MLSTLEKEKLAGEKLGFTNPCMYDSNFVELSYEMHMLSCGYPDIAFRSNKSDQLNFECLIQVAQVFSKNQLLKRLLWEKLCKSLEFIKIWNKIITFNKFIIAFWVTKDVYNECKNIIFLYNILISYYLPKFKFTLIICPENLKDKMYTYEPTNYSLMGLYHPKTIKRRGKHDMKYYKHKKEYPKNIIQMLEYIEKFE